MQTSCRVVIALSMMVVTGTVARNLWAAEEPVPPSPPASEPARVEPQNAVPATVVPTVPVPAEPGPTTLSPAETTPAETASAPEPNATLATQTAPSFWSRPPVPHHARQHGLSLLPGSGYRVIVPYKEEVMCGDASGNASRRVCTHGVPFFLELQWSFGIYARLDFIADLRFGLQKEPGTLDSHGFAFAPGFRFWLDQEVALKFYTTAQAVYDYVHRIPVSSSDFALRNANGLMYDPIRNLGLYVQLGWTMGFVRWFRMELDAGLGVQIRYP